MINQKIKRIIDQNGFISISDFIEIALTDLEYGYYTNTLPIGLNSDFTTSPEISQLFGEMLGFWIIYNWEVLKKPKKIHLIELGAGYGTLMLDALNIIKKVPEIFSSLEISILDISETLKNIQKTKLINFIDKIKWVNDLENNTYSYPIILLANEFFDALPIKQFKYTKNNWHEVNINYNNEIYNLVLDQSPCILDKFLPQNFIPNENMIFEYSPLSLYYLQNINKLIQKNTGIATIIDYGYTKNEFTNTIQSVSKHKRTNFLENVGKQDITNLVNFPLLIDYIKSINNNVKLDIISQRNFLLNLGIENRLQVLLKATKESEKNDIISGVERIINKENMGSLFKVLVFGNY